MVPRGSWASFFVPLLHPHLIYVGSEVRLRDLCPYSQPLPSSPYQPAEFLAATTTAINHDQAVVVAPPQYTIGTITAASLGIAYLHIGCLNHPYIPNGNAYEGDTTSHRDRPGISPRDQPMLALRVYGFLLLNAAGSIGHCWHLAIFVAKKYRMPSGSVALHHTCTY
ncbi:hypothetical protein LZ32DRAFT_306202 [Colletotrichum eremochloae]|nr:hypothetical protein LZ32DRAFT_306202 [Colletotrichum eremochloae]